MGEEIGNPIGIALLHHKPLELEQYSNPAVSVPSFFIKSPGLRAHLGRTAHFLLQCPEEMLSHLAFW